VQTVPACENSTDWPPIVTLPVRVAIEPAFDPTLTMTVPSPVLDDGATDAHDDPLDADHEQLGAFVVTPMLPTPPATSNGPPRVDVLSVTLHVRPACVIWNNCPPMLNAPARGVVVVFGATEYSSVPGPSFEPPDVIVIQLGPVTVS